MLTIVFFILFFIYFPLLIATIRALRNLMVGPRDDSLYSQQMYRESTRRAWIELGIAYLIAFSISCGLFFLLVNRPR